MILNEDYFDDLEIKDEHIIDDINDVGEPEHMLTLEDVQKLPKQYKYYIVYTIDINRSTSLLTRILNRLGTIFEMYGIEHYEYAISSYFDIDICNTVVKYGNYQLLCDEDEKDKFINNIYGGYFYIHVYLNYPQFNYKRAFRFMYSMLNTFKITRYYIMLSFDCTIEHDDDYYFYFIMNDKKLSFYDITGGVDAVLSNEKLTLRDKKKFYYCVINHFFGDEVDIDYDALERDVPLKPIILKR